MSSPGRALALLPVLTFVVTVAACTGPGGSATTSGSASVSPLQAELDALPTVAGANRTATSATAQSVTETFTVPAGTPACLQILARLDAGGYEVVSATSSSAVMSDTCLTTSDGDDVGTAGGSATVLAAGASTIGLTWTATTYTLTATG